MNPMKLRIAILSLCLLLCLLCTIGLAGKRKAPDPQQRREASEQALSSKTITGKVTKVFDGDTINIVDENNTEYRVRFQAVDAPEHYQDFGDASRKHLHSLIFGKTVQVKVDKIDHHDRVVGRIWLGNRDIEQEMLEAGLVWHYVKFNKEAKLAEAQKKAQEAKLGIWSKPNPTPPWEWRYQQREKQHPQNAGEKAGMDEDFEPEDAGAEEGAEAAEGAKAEKCAEQEKKGAEQEKKAEQKKGSEQKEGAKQAERSKQPERSKQGKKHRKEEKRSRR